MARALRIAILAHSTNPRGGVVHALELGDALVRLGHEAVVHAPDSTGKGFFRPSLCATVSVAASPAGDGMTGLVTSRIADYVRHFAAPSSRRFDVFHAQDGISANALASLRERGLIQRFLRTVHHVDRFADPALAALQRRSILAADRHIVVSRLWRNHLAQHFGLAAEIVGNGVDRDRFTPIPDGSEAALRRRLALGAGPVFLSVGGIEERKNTLRLLDAFAAVRPRYPTAQLVIAGGASLLDHHAYRRRFAASLAAAALPPGAVIETGPLPQPDMPALYRLADALVFPSLTEGFGLVVLEAMASGLPVVASKVAPFTEYLGAEDVAWCDPRNTASIARAMAAVLGGRLRRRLIEKGEAVARRHEWRATALAHLRVYESLGELHHA